jgi:hypothetical protein
MCDAESVKAKVECGLDNFKGDTGYFIRVVQSIERPGNRVIYHHARIEQIHVEAGKRRSQFSIFEQVGALSLRVASRCIRMQDHLRQRAGKTRECVHS